MSTSRRLAAVVAAGVLLVACSEPEDSTTSTTTTSTTTSTTITQPIGPPPALKVTTIAKFEQPVAFAQRKDDDTMFIAEKTGTVRALRNGIVDAEPVLDIRNEIGTPQSEQGLLGIAFSPDASKLYVDFTDSRGDSRIIELTVTPAGAVDLRSRRELLFQDQPYPNHNGGHLAFGPDGLLYIGFGDGGGGGDPDKNGQDLTTLLGKMIRIDPRPTPDSPYTIPFDNPLTKQRGARGEIWAYGLRNPWRFSFDRSTGALWIADVGQGKWEEINVVPKAARGGQNYGWPLREGSHEFSGGKPKDAIEPVYEYGHDNGACSVTGGFIYRGKTIPDLTGRYVFGDYCNGRISTLTQRGNVWQADPTGLDVQRLASFGEDHNGEIYTLSQSGELGRIDPG